MLAETVSPDTSFPFASNTVQVLPSHQARWRSTPACAGTLTVLPAQSASATTSAADASGYAATRWRSIEPLG